MLEVAHPVWKKADYYCTQFTCSSYSLSDTEALCEVTNGERKKARAVQGSDMISIATDADMLVLGFAAHMAV